MKITDLHVGGFGVWNSLRAEDLSPEVTLFYGPNEAGKTTLMQFIRAVLYGFSEERRHLYLPPVFGGNAGGALHVHNHGGSYTIERNLENDDPKAIGRAVVLAENGSRQGQHLLSVLLAGVDESIFNNVFAVGIRELQELATLNDTQAAEQLYELASGVDRVSLVDVMRKLQTERTGLWNGEGRPSELADLTARRGRLAAEIDGLELQTRRWAELAREQRSLVAEIDEVEQRITRLELDSRTVETSLQVRGKWNQRSDLSRQLTKIGHVEPLPAGCVSQLDEFNERIARKREELKPKKTQRLEIRRELAAQPINRALWDTACRIEALCEQAPWLASLDREVARLRDDIASSEQQLAKLDAELASAGGVRLADGVVVSPRTFQNMLAPAHALREAIRKRTIARTHHKKSRQEESEASDDLAHELSGRDPKSFEEAMQRVAEHVKLFRRRIQLDERIEAMQAQSEELEQDNHELVDTQFQRVRLFVGIGGVFVFGMVLLLTAIFGHHVMPIEWEIRWGVGLLGVMCLGVAMAWKTMVERSAQEELDECFRRRETLQRELAHAAEERHELDQQLPTGSGTLATRLANAEKELQELEAKMPLQQDRKQAERRAHQSKRYAHGAAEELREAKARWRRALRSAGLPETLAPSHVKKLAAHHEKQAKIQSQRDEQTARLVKLEEDRGALVERLQKLNEDIGLTLVSENPHVQLSQLAAALSGQREMVDRRRELQRQEKEVKRELAEGLQSLRRLSRQREALFATARVTDEEQLRERAVTLQKIADLTARRATLSEQITATIGSHCEEEAIEAELREHGDEELNDRWESLTSKLQDAQALLGQLHQRHGEVNQEMKSLSENQRLAAAKFELGCLEQKIAACVRRWRTLAVTLRMLEDIRESYEAERQPETLGEASLYLQKLTAGKYTRVWTPLGKHELRVDDAQGQPVSLDVLSRGTREAIFLSLRLALAAAYGRRGVNIPMILDDVLVNLDAKRAEAAVELLRDFAKEGRQLLFFTCHEHIKQMFGKADVDVRVLPAHGQPGLRVERLQWQQPSPAEPEEDRLVDFEPPADEEEIPAEIWDAKLPEVVEEPEEQEQEILLVEEQDGDDEYQLEEAVDVETPATDFVELLLEPDEESEADGATEEFASMEDDEQPLDDTWWWEPVSRYVGHEEKTAS